MSVPIPAPLRWARPPPSAPAPPNPRRIPAPPRLRPSTVASTGAHLSSLRRSETFQDAANVYLVLEYCHGGDLFGLMGMYDDEVLPVDSARFYSASIASVFQHIHSKRIIYRDLKTENLLLDRQGFLKVADFGFAKKLGEEAGVLGGEAGIMNATAVG